MSYLRVRSEVVLASLAPGDLLGLRDLNRVVSKAPVLDIRPNQANTDSRPPEGALSDIVDDICFLHAGARRYLLKTLLSLAPPTPVAPACAVALAVEDDQLTFPCWVRLARQKFGMGRHGAKLLWETFLVAHPQSQEYSLVPVKPPSQDLSNKSPNESISQFRLATSVDMGEFLIFLFLQCFNPSARAKNCENSADVDSCSGSGSGNGSSDEASLNAVKFVLFHLQDLLRLSLDRKKRDLALKLPPWKSKEAFLASVGTSGAPTLSSASGSVSPSSLAFSGAVLQSNTIEPHEISRLSVILQPLGIPRALSAISPGFTVYPLPPFAFHIPLFPQCTPPTAAVDEAAGWLCRRIVHGTCPELVVVPQSSSASDTPHKEREKERGDKDKTRQQHTPTCTLQFVPHPGFQPAPPQTEPLLPLLPLSDTSTPLVPPALATPAQVAALATVSAEQASETAGLATRYNVHASQFPSALTWCDAIDTSTAASAFSDSSTTLAVSATSSLSAPFLLAASAIAFNFAHAPLSVSGLALPQPSAADAAALSAILPPPVISASAAASSAAAAAAVSAAASSSSSVFGAVNSALTLSGLPFGAPPPLALPIVLANVSDAVVVVPKPPLTASGALILDAPASSVSSASVVRNIGDDHAAAGDAKSGSSSSSSASSSSASVSSGSGSGTHNACNTLVASDLRIDHVSASAVFAPLLLRHVFATNVSRSTLFLGTVAGVCVLRGLSHCTVTVAARRIVLIACSNVVVKAFTEFTPLVDDACRGIVLGPLGTDYPGIIPDLVRSGMLPHSALAVSCQSTISPAVGSVGSLAGDAALGSTLGSALVAVGVTWRLNIFDAPILIASHATLAQRKLTPSVLGFKSEDAPVFFDASKHLPDAAVEPSLLARTYLQAGSSSAASSAAGRGESSSVAVPLRAYISPTAISVAGLPPPPVAQASGAATATATATANANANAVRQALAGLVSVMAPADTWVGPFPLRALAIANLPQLPFPGTSGSRELVVQKQTLGPALSAATAQAHQQAQSYVAGLPVGVIRTDFWVSSIAAAAALSVVPPSAATLDMVSAQLAHVGAGGTISLITKIVPVSDSAARAAVPLPLPPPYAAAVLTRRGRLIEAQSRMMDMVKRRGAIGAAEWNKFRATLQGHFFDWLRAKEAALSGNSKNDFSGAPVEDYLKLLSEIDEGGTIIE